MVRNWIGKALVALTASGMIGVACGGGPASPGSPSARTETSSAAPAAVSGATISGTVVGVIASTGWTTLRVPLSVTVSGTNITATVDDGGRFTLINVPAGRVDLHFVGPGIDAHLVVDVTSANATIEITVRVNGNNAQLENGNSGPNPGPGTGTPPPDARAEVEGTINAGSITGSCAANNLSFMVGTTKVVTNASTQFRDGTCASLTAGSRVEAKGTRQTDGSILATEVEGKDEDDDDDDDDDDDAREVRMTGTIATGSLAGSCTASTLSFRISSTTIRTSSSTRFKDVACSALKAGDRLEVRGARQTDQSVLASRVEKDH
jgi:uncharacterized protein DUF5666